MPFTPTLSTLTLSQSASSATVPSAVLIELAEVMRDELQNSNTVKLDNFGTFKINIKSTGAESEDKFTATENIVGARVRFQPTMRRDTATGNTTTYFTDGLKYKSTDGFVRA